MENTRYEDLNGELESSNDEALGKYWASLGIFSLMMLLVQLIVVMLLMLELLLIYLVVLVS